MSVVGVCVCVCVCGKGGDLEWGAHASAVFFEAMRLRSSLTCGAVVMVREVRHCDRSASAV